MRGSAGRVDLHVHTTASDGRASPEAVVAMAAAAGLAAIAIADHDTTDGIAAAEAAGPRYGVRVLRAIEINSDVPGDTEVHILGYFIDPGALSLRDFLGNQREARQLRARRIVERLVELGYELEWEHVLTKAAGAVITRPHIAWAMVERGYVAEMGEAMGGLLKRGGAAYVPRPKLTPQGAVQVIRAAGGAAVLAHPGPIGDDSWIDTLVPEGLAGLEVYHPKHTKDQERHYLAMAAERDLLITGGSDYHALGRPGEVPVGGRWVPDDVIGELVARASGRAR